MPVDYTPIEKFGWIRLAILQPGRYDDPLEVLLEPAQLLPRPTRYFEALSYVWGSERSAYNIFIDGTKTPSYGNLVSALRRLRFKDRIRVIWVDAICINQSDNEEKRHQVELMATIYKLADKVLIHLGSSYTPEDQRAMDIIAAVDQPLTADIARQVSDAVFTRTWFDRLWVVQEAALARVAVVILGDKAVRWDCFTAWPMRVAPFQLDKELPGILGLPPRFQPVEGSFLQRLHETRSLKSTDPRDKIFGLLGLIPDREPWLKLVDYSMTCGDVYTNVARCFVETEKSLRFLSAIHRVSALSHSSSMPFFSRSMMLPSWVPDWSTCPDIVPLGIGREFQEPYNAGGYPAVANVVENSLIATGVHLDSITWVGSPYKGNVSVPGSNLLLPDELAWNEASWKGEVLFKSNMTTFKKLDAGTIVACLAKLAIEIESRNHTDSILRPLAHTKDAAVALRAVTTAAPPTSIPQDEEIDCRKWKSLPSKEEIHGHRLDDTIDRVCFRRRIFETESGLLGLGPHDMEPGDSVVVLLGGPVPYILRNNTWTMGRGTYELIGECYVHGVMGGEALRHLHDELGELGQRLGPCGPPICDAKLERFEVV